MASRTHRFESVLSSAVLEWLLMLLLYLNALFSYLVTRFARSCKLQTPCMLCSRLDHILGNEKPGFYINLFCDAHKFEISSLAYCHSHRKLADVHDMCEGCLLSFATEKKSNPETYRSLVSKLRVDPGDSENAYPKLPEHDGGLQNRLHGEDVAEVPLLKNSLSTSLITRHCSCCFEPLRNKLHAVKLSQKKPIDVDIGKMDISLMNSTGHSHLRHRDGLGEIKEKSFWPPAIYHSGSHNFDRLSHIGYREVKVTSDSDSEVQFSDDEDGNTMNHKAEDFKIDLVDQCHQPEPTTIVPRSLSTLSDNISPEKLIYPADILLEPSVPVSEKQLHIGESYDISSLASTVASIHGSEEFNWKIDKARINTSAQSEITSEQVPSEVSDAKHTSENVEVVCFSTSSAIEVSKAWSSTETNLETSQIMHDPGLSVPTHMDLNDAYKLAIGNKSSLTSPTVTDVITGRDPSRVHEDLKLLITQISAAQGVELPWNGTSPSPKISDASVVLQHITKRLSIERNESGLESLDGSIVSEIEGESAVDRLKRQTELDRKSMYLLYKELEEERSASAIAANQAMAMITRLQEEKAALQMEALQYQRMMEEQAEYDQEALQKSNELLAQREKDLQDLEAKVESYRKHFGDVNFAKKLLEPYADSRATESSKKYRVDNNFELTESGILKDPLLGFEDEKAYISDCLKKLEKNLLLFSNNGVYADMAEILDKPCEYIRGEDNDQGNSVLRDAVSKNDQNSEEAVGGNDLESSYWKNASMENSQMGGKVLSEKKDSSLSREDSNANASSHLSTQGAHFTITDNHKESLVCFNADNNGPYLSTVGKMTKLVSLENEISHLNERLESLEADHNFLEHTINSLRNGDDGLRFIQEIACHLQGLRRIGITRGGHTET